MRSVINWETAHAVGTIMLGIGVMLAYAWGGLGTRSGRAGVRVRTNRLFNPER